MFVAAGFFISPFLTWMNIAIFNFALAAIVVVLYFVLYGVVVKRSGRKGGYAPLGLDMMEKGLQHEMTEKVVEERKEVYVPMEKDDIEQPVDPAGAC